MLLSDFIIGQSGKISKINACDKVKKRYYALGLCVGARVTMVRRSPFNDPIEIKVRDFYLAIRRRDAKKIEMERL